MNTVLLVATLAVVFAVVAVLVGYLVAIIVALWRAERSLAQLAGGLAAIRDHTQPLGAKVGAINGGLGALLQGLRAVNGDLAAIVGVAQGRKTS